MRFSIVSANFTENASRNMWISREGDTFLLLE